MRCWRSFSLVENSLGGGMSATLFTFGFRWFLFRPAWMFAECGESHLPRTHQEELGHLARRLSSEPFCPEVAGQHDRQATRDAGYFVGQIIAGNFVLDLVVA